MWFWKCILNFDFLIGIIFSSDSAFAWMPLGLIHDKSFLLQEWLGAIIQQTFTPGITSANVDADICRHMMFLLSRMSYSQTRDPSLLTYLRLRQNGATLQTACWNTFYWLKYILLSTSHDLDQWPGARFTKDISHGIKIRWQLYFDLT